MSTIILRSISAVFLITLLVTSSAFAQRAKVNITSTTISFDDGIITIIGESFDIGPNPTEVFLGGVPLNIQSNNGSTIVAELPDNLAPGQYDLLVKSGPGQRKMDNETVTIGEQGPQGDMGDPGDPGDQGPQGPQGPQGGQGPQGPTGATGPAGPPGAQGPPGPQGPIGIDGPPGEQGLPGQACWDIDNDNVCNITTEDADGNGTCNINDCTGPMGLDGPPGEQGLTGAQGPQGPIGLTGPAGADGEQGPAGPQGIPGDQGIQGLTGAQGPQGPIGLTGPAGADGEQGTAGADGAAFAYQVSLDIPLGVCPDDKATELQGGPDADGDNVPDSITVSHIICDGADGADGAQGSTGLQGPVGAKGADGNDGTDGSNGSNGVCGYSELRTELAVGGNGSCPGGVLADEIVIGIDNNCNGALDIDDTFEITSVCNGADGSDGADGDPGLTNRIVVTNTSNKTFSNSELVELNENCEPGVASTLIGGGCSVDEVSNNNDDLTITTISNGPLNSSSNDTWHCKFWNRTSSNRTVTIRAYAICAEVD